MLHPRFTPSPPPHTLKPHLWLTLCSSLYSILGAPSSNFTWGARFRPPPNEKTRPSQPVRPCASDARGNTILGQQHTRAQAERDQAFRLLVRITGNAHLLFSLGCVLLVTAVFFFLVFVVVVIKGVIVPCALARLGEGRVLVMRLRGLRDSATKMNENMLNITRYDRRSCKQRPCANHHRTG